MIDKAITIVAPAGVYAGISVTSGHGIDVNPGAGKVVLRGLVINGLGGDIGINLMSGDALYVENCVVSGFTNTGIYAVPPAPAIVFVRNSTIRDNNIGAMFGTTAGASGTEVVQIERSEFDNNASIGFGFTGGSALGSIENSTVTRSTLALSVNPTVSGAAVKFTAQKTTFAAASASGVRVGGAAGTSAIVSIVKSQISESGIGLEMLTGGIAYLSDTTVARNTTGITTLSGSAVSLGDNRLTSNGINGAFSASIPRQ
jgi:hypothetical protein